MSGETNQESGSKELSLTTEDILSSIDGIPLPPVIKKSLWKAIGRLITGLVDVPVAYLEAKAQQITAEGNALSLVTKYASEAAAIEFGQDKFLIGRTVNHFGSRLLREQINRENTVKKAIDDLKTDSPKEDSKEEIDPDWLEMFSDITGTKSNEEVQLFLAKILAGEMRRPGSFSLKTIQTLSLLDQKTAKVFQLFCNISFEVPQAGDLLTCVICDPFGSPGQNELLPLGLSYGELSQLQDAGLIQHDLTAWREIPSMLFSLPIKIGDEVFSFYETEMDSAMIQEVQVNAKKIRVNIINFTTVGLELRKVLHITSNQTYNERFVEWIKPKITSP